MIGMLKCFTVKTHSILMKFKRRKFYLWIKVHKDLLLTLSEILTAFFFLREKEKARKERFHILYIVVVSWINVPSKHSELLSLLTLVEIR